MIIWKLKSILDTRGITRYQLQKQSGISMNTIYGMYDGETLRPALESVSEVLKALQVLTGETFGVSDILEYTPHSS